MQTECNEGLMWSAVALASGTGTLTSGYKLRFDLILFTLTEDVTGHDLSVEPEMTLSLRREIEGCGVMP